MHPGHPAPRRPRAAAPSLDHGYAVSMLPHHRHRIASTTGHGCRSLL